MNFSQATEICLAEIEEAEASLIYLLGADDSGKSTLAKELANGLILKGKRVAIIDADSGQSSRLPLTLSLNYAQAEFRQLSQLPLVHWDFMPSYDLLEYFDRYIELMEKWTRRAREERDCCLVDSNGDVRKSLKLKELELLSPDLVVALQRESELEPIIKSLRSRILRLPVPEEVGFKSWKQRRKRRNEKFRRYFEHSSVQVINCKTPFDFKHLPVPARQTGNAQAGRIVGLYRQGEFLGLGIVIDRNANGLKVITPVPEEAGMVEFSSVKMDEAFF